MAAVNIVGKKVEEIHGRYLFTSKASIVYFINKNNRDMQVLINASTGGNDRSMIIEADGFIAVADTNELDLMWLSEYKEFDCKVI